MWQSGDVSLHEVLADPRCRRKKCMSLLGGFDAAATWSCRGVQASHGRWKDEANACSVVLCDVPGLRQGKANFFRNHLGSRGDTLPILNLNILITEG